MLNIDSFRAIRPCNAKDNYQAGEDNSGNSVASNIEKGKSYRESICNFLLKHGPSTTIVISESLGLCKKIVANAIQKMFLKGIITRGEKVAGKGKKKSYPYSVA